MPAPKPLTPHEEALLRLYRCMTKEEQADCRKGALLQLAGRCSLDPMFRTLTPEQIQDECEEVDDVQLDARLKASWPGDWPGRRFVDLENTGDAGAWLDEVMGERPVEQLFGWAWNDEECATGMAEQYFIELTLRGLDLPSAFDEPGEMSDNIALLEEDFVTFLRHWRERVIAALEAQNPPTGSPGAPLPVDG